MMIKLVGMKRLVWCLMFVHRNVAISSSVNWCPHSPWQHHRLDFGEVWGDDGFIVELRMIIVWWRCLRRMEKCCKNLLAHLGYNHFELLSSVLHSLVSQGHWKQTWWMLNIFSTINNKTCATKKLPKMLCWSLCLWWQSWEPNRAIRLPHFNWFLLTLRKHAARPAPGFTYCPRIIELHLLWFKMIPLSSKCNWFWW